VSRFTKLGLVAIVGAALILIGRAGIENAGPEIATGPGGKDDRRTVEDVTWLLQSQRTSRVPLRDLFSPATATQGGGLKEKTKSEPPGEHKPVRKKPRSGIKTRQPPRLVGIAIRRNIARAFFVDGKEILIAAPGDRVRGYRISRIEEKQVHVYDLRNGLKRTIFLE